MPKPPRKRHPRPGTGREAPVDPKGDTGPIDTGPIDTGPFDHGDPTLPDEFDYGSMFRVLDRGLPLALLPLRLEVRWWMASTPPELRVRIFPDTVHADGHNAELTATEQALGQAYWRRCWRAGPTPPFTAGHDAAFAWLAGQTGPWRAAWVARATMPLNSEQAPPRPVPEPAPLLPAPHFPAAKPRATGGPVTARLLPSRFALVLIDDGTVIGTWWGEEVAQDVALAPGLVEAGEDLDGRALLDAQGLTWTYDFNLAVELGLGIRVKFSELPERFLRRGFSQLLVLGVRTADQQAELEALLTAHRYTHGLDVIPQGTPTNATETAAPGISLERPDLPAVRASEFPPGKIVFPGPKGGRTVESPPAPGVSDDGDLYRMTAAAAASAALGIASGGALDRAANARLAELGRAEAMGQALWPGLMGNYLDAVMQVGLNAPTRAWLRDWSAHYVRGGALLPTLLVGAQPYGLLPVSQLDPVAAPEGRVEHIQQVLDQLAGNWLDLVDELPRLDPDAGDQAPGEGERAALVSQILGAVPHPTTFSLQRVEDERTWYATFWNASLLWTLAGAAIAPYSDGTTGKIGTVPASWDDPAAIEQFDGVMWNPWLGLRSRLLEANTTGDQLFALEAYRADLEQFRDSPTYTGVKDFYEHWEAYVRETLIAFVQAHADRTLPIEWLTGLVPSVTRMVGDADDPSACFAMHPSRQDVALPLVAAGREADDVTDLEAWMSALAADLAAGRPPEHDYGTAHPLLRQMLAWSAERAAGTDDAAAVSDGLTTLLGLVRTAADPVGELERLLRETVSTHAGRLDAWYTAIAAARLEGKRHATATGVQVGAYGWLEDVRPRQRRASQGYVLAPSPAHATTAAILRSGWSAFGGDAGSAGLAVDLSSDRIRRARWLMDGVRRGQDLGALLGARLERRLQDAGLAGQIEDLRKAALRAADSSAAPTTIVDGLLVARGRAYQEAPADEQDDYSEAEVAAAGEIESLLAGADLSAAERTAFGALLDDSLDDLDAMADAAVAQSVFSLAEGNVPEATTTMTAAATGEVAFPRLRFADGRRAATTITHRLLLLVEADATGTWPGAKTSGRALAAPALEAWAEGVLGDPGRYSLSATFADPAGGAAAAPPVRRTLADVGLAALDVIALAPTGEETGLGRLGAALASWAEGLRPAEMDPAAPLALTTDGGDPSLDDLAVAGRALRALLEDARDLDGRDLAAPGVTDAVSGLDTRELDSRMDDVRAALVAGDAGVAAALAAGRDLRAPLLALSGFALPGIVPRGTDPAAHADQATALRTAIADRLTALDARVADEEDGWEARDEDSRWRALRDRLRLLVGEPLAIAAPFTAADAGGLDATFGRPRLAVNAATRWLSASGRVDLGARRLRLATDLAEALDGSTRFSFALGQLPDHPDEGWAAVTRPDADERGRLCLLATGAKPAFADGPTAGLVLGAWTEVIPQQRRTAALGVHFDSPAARAPQAVLLCTASEDDGYSFDLVRDLLLQTLQLARLRLVGPQQLDALGQYLPATYLQGSVPAVAS